MGGIFRSWRLFTFQPEPLSRRRPGAQVCHKLGADAASPLKSCGAVERSSFRPQLSRGGEADVRTSSCIPADGSCSYTPRHSARSWSCWQLHMFGPRISGGYCAMKLGLFPGRDKGQNLLARRIVSSSWWTAHHEAGNNLERRGGQGRIMPSW